VLKHTVRDQRGEACRNEERGVALPRPSVCFSTEGGPQYKPAEDAELACKFAFEAGPDRRPIGTPSIRQFCGII
jgi:hypothetical protein